MLTFLLQATDDIAPKAARWETEVRETERRRWGNGGWRAI